MKAPRKYGPGEVITRDEFDALLTRHLAEVFIWFGRGEHGRVEHIGWTMNRAYAQTRRALEFGNVRRAIVTDEYRRWLAREVQEHGAISAEAAE
jgi:hypothetical protein